MSKEGVPAETIVKKMRDSKSVYRLTAAQLAYLHDQGVADRVINYMQQTYLEAVRREQNLRTGILGKRGEITFGKRQNLGNKQPARKINKNPLASKESESSCW